jgi:hypothetical protein
MVDEEPALPTEEYVDMALEKSESLMGQLAKLGISFDVDDDASTQCSGLGGTMSLGGSITTIALSGSDPGDEIGHDESQSDTASSSPETSEMSDHVQNVAALLTLREKVYRLRESVESEERAENLARLEKDLQALAAKMAGAGSVNVQPKLQRLEEAVELLKKQERLYSFEMAPSKRAASPPRVTKAAPTPARTSIRPMAPPRRSCGSVTLPVPPRFPQRHTLGPLPLRAISPNRRQVLMSPRAVSPARAISPPPAPKRLFCQQVAVTRVYNFWSLQD